MATKPPLAFLSYATQDDAHEGGKLRTFAERLSGEVQFQSGEEFPIFVDRNDVKWGQEWRSRIEQSLGATTFLIPILTPRYFNRDWCRKEFFLFVEREKELGRSDLILPVYYASCPKLEDPEKGAQDKLAQVLRNRQYKDCRTLRYLDWAKPEVTRLFEQMALDIVAALERKDSPPPVMRHGANELSIRTPVSKSPETTAGSDSLSPAQPVKTDPAPLFEERGGRQTVAAQPEVEPQAHAPKARVAAAKPQPHEVRAATHDANEEASGEPVALLPVLSPPPPPRLTDDSALEPTVEVPHGTKAVSSGQTPVPPRVEIVPPQPKPPEVGSQNAVADASRDDRLGQHQTGQESDDATHAENSTFLYDLGLKHELGLGVTPDLAKARECYIRAARKGQPDAMNSLGLLYEQGEGVITPSVAKARFWFRLATRHGSAAACENLKRFVS